MSISTSIWVLKNVYYKGFVGEAGLATYVVARGLCGTEMKILSIILQRK